MSGVNVTRDDMVLHKVLSTVWSFMTHAIWHTTFLIEVDWKWALTRLLSIGSIS